jgi:hypothetical protein
VKSDSTRANDGGKSGKSFETGEPGDAMMDEESLKVERACLPERVRWRRIFETNSWLGIKDEHCLNRDGIRHERVMLSWDEEPSFNHGGIG